MRLEALPVVGKLAGQEHLAGEKRLGLAHRGLHSLERGPLMRAELGVKGRAEMGEERFSVEWREDGTVWYDLLAFSRPRLWLARLAHPLTRRVQRRFARESKAAMQAACGSTPPS